MKKIILNLWTSHKEKQRKQQEAEITHAYNIIEKNGVIYVTAGIRAIKVIEPYTMAEDIVKILNDCRKAHIQFTENKN